LKTTGFGFYAAPEKVADDSKQGISSVFVGMPFFFDRREKKTGRLP